MGISASKQEKARNFMLEKKNRNIRVLTIQTTANPCRM